MQDFLKKLYYGVWSFFNTIVSMISILMFSSWKVARELRRMPRQSGKKVSILANGPSLRNVLENHRNLLYSNDLMMLNDSANAEAFKELKPRYFILLDPAYFRPEWKVDREVGNEDFYIRVVLKLIENLKSVDWDMTLLLPANKSAKNMAKLFVGHKYVKVEKYNATRIQGFEKFRRWAYKMGFGIPSSRNIVIPALLQMISRGYDTIYLYGTEFSWIKLMDVDPENGRMFQNDRHFYSTGEIRYYEKGAFVRILESITAAFRGIESVAAYAKKSEVQVINRTKRSFIDSFDYENIDKISDESR